MMCIIILMMNELHAIYLRVLTKQGCEVIEGKWYLSVHIFSLELTVTTSEVCSCFLSILGTLK